MEIYKIEGSLLVIQNLARTYLGNTICDKCEHIELEKNKEKISGPLPMLEFKFILKGLNETRSHLRGLEEFLGQATKKYSKSRLRVTKTGCPYDLPIIDTRIEKDNGFLCVHAGRIPKQYRMEILSKALDEFRTQARDIVYPHRMDVDYLERL